MLGDVVEDHLPAHRGDSLQADDEVDVGDAVLVGDSVAAMGLDRLVDGAGAGVGGEQLGDVRGLPGGRAGVGQGRRLHHHQARCLELRVAFGEWMGHALVGADRLPPDFALAPIPRRLAERVTPRPAAQRRRHDPLRVEAAEDRLHRLAFGADQPVGRDVDFVEGHREGVLGRPHRHRDAVAVEVRVVDLDHEERKLRAAVVAGAGVGEDQHPVGVLEPRAVDLRASEDVGLAVAPGAGGDLVGVGAGVGLGHRQREALGPRRHPRQPAHLLLLRAVPFDDRPGDGGGDQELQERHPGGAHLFLDDRQLAQPGPAAAVALGDRGAHEAVLAERRPERRGRFVLRHDLGEVAVAEALGEVADRLAQQSPLVGIGQGQGGTRVGLDHRSKVTQDQRLNACRES